MLKLASTQSARLLERPSAPQATPEFRVIGAQPIARWIAANTQPIFELVSQAYLAYAQGKALNPDSYFLRFPDQPHNRIIALPASLEQGAAEQPVAGIKWIASFPDNVAAGLDRASAVFILNDRRTGYPLACLEGSLISAVRTAASAVIGAHYLHGSDRIKRLGVVGCGLIALNVIDFLRRMGWQIDAVSLIDHDIARAHALARQQPLSGIACTGGSHIGAIAECDMVLFATSAGAPHVHDPALFAHKPTVLHLSLRDLAPAVILSAQNVVDDVQHCLKAQTSLHLTEQREGHCGFIAGNVAELIGAAITPDFRRPRIYSPFGMGMLDLALAQAIWRSSADEEVLRYPDFFPVPYGQHPTNEQPDQPVRQHA
ncbi:2,3-diaminopropionate biosynthesis protein SbnB [Oxalobacteraceae bacterium]|nr:2,3-diaminopropionate biosynthesis protein SbnB [Oxalobacteraceae bacterium]